MGIDPLYMILAQAHPLNVVIVFVLEVEGGERGELRARDERQWEEGERGGEVETAVEQEV